MSEKLKQISQPVDWQQVIIDSGLSNSELSRQLVSYGYKMSVSGVSALRNKQTAQPSHDVGQAIIQLCLDAKRAEVTKHPSISRTR